MNKKADRYKRIIEQLLELFKPIDNPQSRMATICAVLHHKFPQFFWTGFYLISKDGELEVSTYQGPLACLRLKKDTGVCWAGINQKKTIVVENVHDFEGHIACNPLSKSEIVLPVFENGKIIGVLDIDSDSESAFDQTDAEYLEKILNLIFG